MQQLENSLGRKLFRRANRRLELTQEGELFLASLGTCAGYYVSAFCRQRGITTSGLRIRQIVEQEPTTHDVSRIELRIELPAGFPARYREAVVRAAGRCAVKRQLQDPPQVEVRTVDAEPVVA